MSRYLGVEVYRCLGVYVGTCVRKRTTPLEGSCVVTTTPHNRTSSSFIEHHLR